jgi:hypothetical protein
MKELQMFGLDPVELLAVLAFVVLLFRGPPRASRPERAG